MFVIAQAHVTMMVYSIYIYRPRWLVQLSNVQGSSKHGDKEY